MSSGTTGKTISFGLTQPDAIKESLLFKSFCFDFKYINYLSHFIPSSYVGFLEGEKTQLSLSMEYVLIIASLKMDIATVDIELIRLANVSLPLRDKTSLG